MQVKQSRPIINTSEKVDYKFSRHTHNTVEGFIECFYDQLFAQLNLSKESNQYFSCTNWYYFTEIS